MSAVDWDSATWGRPGHNVHTATEPGDGHTAEPEQEGAR